MRQQCIGRLPLTLALTIAGLITPIFLHAQLFPEIDTNFAGETVQIPSNPFSYTVIFRQGESMVKTKDGTTGLARGNHDFTGYVPIDGASNHGYVIVNHELRDSNSTFGDGGGMTVFEAKVENGAWTVVGDYRNVDFSGVGGTFVNCGGAQTPWGTVLTAEEYPPASNAELSSNGGQFRDTSDVTVTYDGQEYTIERWQNMGWMVEVDPVSATAERKLWKMGRYSHEGGYCMPDGKTVYLTDDFSPAVLFKFVATTPNDYTDGQLYAYKQSEDGKSGEWLTLPMDFDSLLVIRDVAIGMGATLFIRHEWVTEANGKLYITETGRDGFNWDEAVAAGGVPALHLEPRRVGPGYEYEDLYGRVLELDPSTDKVRSYLEGGTAASDPAKNLSNPDGIETLRIDGKDWLVINEDINGRSANRVPEHAEEAGRTIGEIYLLDPAIEYPKVDNLKRLLIGVTGAETTGGKATPDGRTYFVNIQHPSSSNPEPFNRSATIAVTGFGDYIAKGDEFALFPPIDTSFVGETVIVPSNPYDYTVMFRQGESVVKTREGNSGLARGNHDFTGYVPIDGASNHGYVIVNHELRDSNSTFGDGGGMTVFEAKVENGAWTVVGDYRNVDFSGVGGTFVNCGGAQTPWGTVLTAEEYPPASNAELSSNGGQFRDTSDVTVTYDGQEYTIERWQNMGWMVEVDPVSATAERKLWKMGRYSHEGGYCMPDGKTVYLTDDFSPAVLFKFVATTPNDYTDGQLYAYKQSEDGKSGEWLTLPMDFDSLLVIRDVAIGMGATLFIRHEWVTEANGKLYITETGRDGFNWDEAVAAGGVPALHLEPRRVGPGYEYEDFYGRVLELDPSTDKVRSYLEGGTSTWDYGTNLSNPDGIETYRKDGKDWLVINEDINGRDANRVPEHAEEAGRTIGEIYFLDPSIENPTVDDLKRFLIGVTGAETTGGKATPDGRTYFVNIQHPSSSNPEPFNRSATIAVTGFAPLVDASASVENGTERSGSVFQVYPNPTVGRLELSRVADVAIYDRTGAQIGVQMKTRSIDLTDFAPGVYFVQTIEGEVAKVVVE